MPTHWTYQSFDAGDDLLQGDILVPTDELRGVLKRVHTHFVDPKYTAFLLTTHSCDMVRRGTGCSTRYLNIAVVRQLEDVLHDLLACVCEPVAAHVYVQETKVEANRLLERLFNQNEQALGLFYLHPDAEAGISVPSIALLRVGVTLRVAHYDILVRSRRGRLQPEFTAKLGWLVGNLYARVGTPDWTETRERRRELKALIQSTLGPSDPEVAPRWVRQSWVRAAEDNGVELQDLPPDQLEAAIQKHKPPTPKRLAIQQAERIISEVMPGITGEQLRRVRNRLDNDPLFAKALRSANAG